MPPGCYDLQEIPYALALSGGKELKNLFYRFLLCALAITPLKILAQSVSPALQPLAFLSGRWMSESEGHFEEEYWSKAIGNSMVGTFRVIKSGDSIFYEFWAIEVEDGKVIFKMKHFNHGLLGWEEKNDVIRLVMTVKGERNIVFTSSDNSLSLRMNEKAMNSPGN
jgi:hypothetical protein